MKTPVEPYGPARRFAAFMGEIIYAASASPSGVWKDTLISCRRRPGRHVCAGRLRVRDDGDDRIRWVCPVCNDQWEISHWHGSPYDLSALRGMANQPGLAVILTNQEYDDLRKCLVLDPESTAVVYQATPISKVVVLKATADDFDNLAGFLAFEANHEIHSKRQRVLWINYWRVWSCLYGKPDRPSQAI